MEKKMVKAIRMVNGFTDDLRKALPVNWRDYTPQQWKIVWFLRDHLLDIYGINAYEKIGVTFNPQPGKDADDFAKLLRFLGKESTKICLGEYDD